MCQRSSLLSSCSPLPVFPNLVKFNLLFPIMPFESLHLGPLKCVLLVLVLEMNHCRPLVSKNPLPSPMSNRLIQLVKSNGVGQGSICWFHEDNGRDSQLVFLQGANLACLFAYNDLFLTLPSFLIQDTILSNPQRWNLLFWVRQTVTDQPPFPAFSFSRSCCSSNAQPTCQDICFQWQS